MESVQPPKRPLGATRRRAHWELHGGPLGDQTHSSAFFSECPLGATRSTLLGDTTRASGFFSGEKGIVSHTTRAYCLVVR